MVTTPPERGRAPAFAVPRVFGHILLIFALWTLWYTVGRTFPRTVNGYFLEIHAAAIVAAGVYLLRKRCRHEASLPRGATAGIALAYMAWGLSDACWALNYFIGSHNSQTFMAIGVTTLCGFSFALLIFGILRSVADWGAFFDWRVALLSVLVASAAITAILWMPYINEGHQDFTSLLAASEFFTIATGYVLLVLSIAVLLSSRRMSWSIFGAGTMCWVLGDSSIRIGKILNNSIDLDIFTILCSFGIYASLLPWVPIRKRRPIDAVDTSSLFTLFKAGSLITLFACLLVFLFMQSHNLETVRLITLCCGFSSFMCIFLAWFLVGRIRAATTALGALVRHMDDAVVPMASASLPLELRDYYDSALAMAVAEQRRRRGEVEERCRLLRKVAHNILSPVAALNSQLGDIDRLPEEARLIMKTAINDISDLASGLSSVGLKKREELGLERVHLIGVVESVLRQKRSEFRTERHLLIERRGVGGYGAFVDVHEIELRGIVSNLVNNAVQALDGPGEIVVEIEAQERAVRLSVRDNGSGIPPALIPTLAQEGATFGKKNGAGIGLFHARTCVEGWGGSMSIQSELGRGTQVNLSFPKRKPPDWLATHVNIAPGDTLVILDDSPAIHKVWDQKLAPAHDTAGVAMRHFFTVKEFLDWFGECPRTALQSHLYLLDLELSPGEQDGIALAQDLGIADQAILVTSHDCTAAVRERCGPLGLKVLPKGMAGLVPVHHVEVPTGLACDAVLIDDDALFRKVWTRRAAQNDKVIAVFACVGEFRRRAAGIGREVSIYIDSDLEAEIRGEVAAKELHEELGFTNIFLATAHPASDFCDMPWLKGVTGKLPPWPDKAALH